LSVDKWHSQNCDRGLSANKWHSQNCDKGLSANKWHSTCHYKTYWQVAALLVCKLVQLRYKRFLIPDSGN
jgi:hypothetical protein